MKVLIRYTNWKGKTEWRTIIPKGTVWFGSTDYHPEDQWLLPAYDVDKQADRTFALKDISSWEPVEDTPCAIPFQ